MSRLQLSPLVLASSILMLASCADTSPTQPDDVADQPAAAPEFILASNSWVSRAKLPSGRHALVLGVAKNASGRDIIYAIGGYDNKAPYSGQVSSSLTAYDYSTDSWSNKAPMPAGTGHPNGVGLIGGKLYVSGGWKEIANDNVEDLPYLFVYDPLRNSWSRKADMPRAGSNGAAGVIDRKLYVFSGGRLYRYTPSTNKWVTLASCPRAHYTGAGGAIKGKFYMAGGSSTGGTGKELDVYDPATNKWTAKAPMSTARGWTAGAVLKNQLYVVGGRGEPVPGVEAYDPVTNRWSTKRPLAAEREQLGVASFVTPSGNPKILAVGGWEYLTTNELYTP